jgi:cobaltochelatase CobN
MSDRIFHMYGWQATTRLVGNWVFDEIAEKFVLDEETRKWFRENNMYALESIARRLIEAESRELWKADPETLEQIRDVYLDIESWLEDTMDETDADFQGSAIEIIKSARMKTKDEG